MNWTGEEINRLKEKINEKARSDKNFRTLCLTNPEQAIEQISGQKIPPGFKVRFIENEDAHFTHVLPDYIQRTSELSEEELNQVAAGLAGKTEGYCQMCGSTEGFVETQGARFCRNCKTGSYEL